VKELSEKDLKFISGEFFNCDLPNEKLYLFKYFKNESQRQFLRYYFTFGEIKGFSNHTGCVCSFRWLEKLRDRIEMLEKTHDEAKKNLDFEKLSLIKSGKAKYIKLSEDEC
jgi:hypothetical protein